MLVRTARGVEGAMRARRTAGGRVAAAIAIVASGPAQVVAHALRCGPGAGWMPRIEDRAEPDPTFSQPAVRPTRAGWPSRPW
jgi:hypothetical protein